MRAAYLLLLSVLLVPSVSGAIDGRIEINQALVAAAGGFPYTLTTSGSYVLTGPLSVPAGTDGLILDAGHLTLDLNGFVIAGPETCGPSSCVTGTGEAIRPSHPLQDGHHVTVRNGFIRGFGGNCLRLGVSATVDDVSVSECGQFGISVNARSLVTQSRVYRTGNVGLQMSPSALFSNNTLSEAGLAGGGEPAVNGGNASAGNYCDDASCSAHPARRYLLTNALFPADQVLTACPAGFHTASLWEIFNTSTLRYDSRLGYNGHGDAGFGPPGFPGIGWTTLGWIRSGSNNFLNRSCNFWTTTDSGTTGYAVSLGEDWDSTQQIQRISPWHLNEISCGYQQRVWCVQD